MGCGFGKPAVGVSKPASAPQSTLHLVTAAPNPAPAPPPASYAPQKSVDAGGGAATVRTSDGLNGSGKNSAATATSTTTSSGPLMPTQSYDQQFSKAHVVSTDTLTVPSKPPSEPESTPASAGTAAVAVQPRAPASSASASYAHHAQLVQKGVYGVPSQPLSQYTPMPGGVRWRKGEMIGRGAVGAVYLGLNDDTGSLMAVKELQYRADSQKEVEGLMREINVMRSLEHENIVRYLGTEVSGTALYIFTEWVPGGSILNLLEKFTKLKEKVVKNYTRQILVGLGYLHENHVIHRDIKGANILVDDIGRIKLADFGASKRVSLLHGVTVARGDYDEDSQGGAGATATGFVFGDPGGLEAGPVGRATAAAAGAGAGSDPGAHHLAVSMRGTPYFMAPEVIEQRGYSRKSDIWSVGCTVLEMVTGQPPWKSMNFTALAPLLRTIVTTKDGPPVPEECSPELKSFLRLCFAHSPSDRPSAEELLQHPFLLAGPQQSQVSPRLPPASSQRSDATAEAPTDGGIQQESSSGSVPTSGQPSDRSDPATAAAAPIGTSAATAEAADPTVGTLQASHTHGSSSSSAPSTTSGKRAAFRTTRYVPTSGGITSMQSMALSDLTYSTMRSGSVSGPGPGPAGYGYSYSVDADAASASAATATNFTGGAGDAHSTRFIDVEDGLHASARVNPSIVASSRTTTDISRRMKLGAGVDRASSESIEISRNTSYSRRRQGEAGLASYPAMSVSEDGELAPAHTAAVDDEGEARVPAAATSAASQSWSRALATVPDRPGGYFAADVEEDTHLPHGTRTAKHPHVLAAPYVAVDSTTGSVVDPTTMPLADAKVVLIQRRPGIGAHGRSSRDDSSDVSARQAPGNSELPPRAGVSGPPRVPSLPLSGRGVSATGSAVAGAATILATAATILTQLPRIAEATDSASPLSGVAGTPSQSHAGRSSHKRAATPPSARGRPHTGSHSYKTPQGSPELSAESGAASLLQINIPVLGPVATAANSAANTDTATGRSANHTNHNHFQSPPRPETGASAALQHMTPYAHAPGSTTPQPTLTVSAASAGGGTTTGSALSTRNVAITFGGRPSTASGMTSAGSGVVAVSPAILSPESRSLTTSDAAVAVAQARSPIMSGGFSSARSPRLDGAGSGSATLASAGAASLLRKPDTPGHAVLASEDVGRHSQPSSSRGRLHSDPLSAEVQQHQQPQQLNYSSGTRATRDGQLAHGALSELHTTHPLSHAVPNISSPISVTLTADAPLTHVHVGSPSGPAAQPAGGALTPRSRPAVALAADSPSVSEATVSPGRASASVPTAVKARRNEFASTRSTVSSTAGGGGFGTSGANLSSRLIGGNERAVVEQEVMEKYQGFIVNPARERGASAAGGGHHTHFASDTSNLSGTSSSAGVEGGLASRPGADVSVSDTASSVSSPRSTSASTATGASASGPTDRVQPPDALDAMMSQEHHRQHLSVGRTGAAGTPSSNSARLPSSSSSAASGVSDEYALRAYLHSRATRAFVSTLQKLNSQAPDEEEGSDGDRVALSERSLGDERVGANSARHEDADQDRDSTAAPAPQSFLGGGVVGPVSALAWERGDKEGHGQGQRLGSPASHSTTTTSTSRRRRPPAGAHTTPSSAEMSASGSQQFDVTDPVAAAGRGELRLASISSSSESHSLGRPSPIIKGTAPSSTNNAVPTTATTSAQS